MSTVPRPSTSWKVLGSQIGVEVYTEEGNRNPVQIAENAIRYARQKSYNVVIVDTAGRLAVDEAMMQEITAIKAAVKPSETLFVVDAMTGQDAVNTAREFNDRLDFGSGSSPNSTATPVAVPPSRSVRSSIKPPLKFISSGEKPDAHKWLPTPSEWPPYYWAWATLYRSWSVPRSSSTRRRPATQEEARQGPGQLQRLHRAESSRSRRWAT